MRALLSLFVALSPLLVIAAPSADPCVKIAGKAFVPPADALACEKSFAFNETLRQNLLTVMERVFDFFTFEDYYLNSPPPFQESTINIRETLTNINRTQYAVWCWVLPLFFGTDAPLNRPIMISTLPYMILLLN
jgi:hypothetical protein